MLGTAYISALDFLLKDGDDFLSLVDVAEFLLSRSVEKKKTEKSDQGIKLDE